MSYTHDVIIIGAGPAGSSAAYHLYSQGIENILVIDKCMFPRDKICAGGLTLRAQKCLAEMQVLDEVKARGYEVPTTLIVTPNGKTFKLRKEIHHMYVMRRRLLDALVLERTRLLGVKVREGVHVEGLLKKDGEVRGIVTRNGEHLEAKVIVVASGTNSARFIQSSRPSIQMLGYMGWFEGTRFLKNAAYYIYDEELLPLYGWVFPESDDLVNIGIVVEGSHLSSREIKLRFDTLISRYLQEYMENAHRLGPARGYPIRSSYHIQNLVDGNVVYVGEAGGIVSPRSGEGISQALISGKFAANAISHYLSTFDQKHLMEYERMVRKEFYFFPRLRWIKMAYKHKVTWRIREFSVTLMGIFQNPPNP